MKALSCGSGQIPEPSAGRSDHVKYKLPQDNQHTGADWLLYQQNGMLLIIGLFYVTDDNSSVKQKHTIQEGKTMDNKESGTGKILTHEEVMKRIGG